MVEKTKWHQEMELFYHLKSGLILEGNVQDVYLFPEEGPLEGSVLSLQQYLHYFFKARGYELIVRFDPVRGFSSEDGEEALREFVELTNPTARLRTIRGGCSLPVPFSTGRDEDSAPDYCMQLMAQNKKPAVLVMDMASRYIVGPDRMSGDDVHAYTTLQLAMRSSATVSTPAGLRKNLLILIASKQNDLPSWLYMDNPVLWTIHITPPSASIRREMVSGRNLRYFFGPSAAEQLGSIDDEELTRLQDRFVAKTDGLSCYEINSMRSLCRQMNYPVRELCSVIDLYRYGIKENPWQSSMLAKRLENAQERFYKRVKGQNEAVARVLDVVKRSVVSIDRSNHSAKPKGILFFAGPTGTGKTETAKTLAELLFGDEKACIRFDMSEYSQPHSDQRLLGAPPGYVGYEAGGQLTNAVRQNPFSILLFDEIEKAHPSILDKFLQILEDGRMTDGQGNTVYFSETLIIFTSNLGMLTTDSYGNTVENVKPDMTYDEIKIRIRREMEHFFKQKLQRPELLNRIGENIIVFDFIRRDSAEQILNSRLNNLADNLYQERKLKLKLSEDAMAVLRSMAQGNLSNGGRGINQIVEAALLNPLSRYLFQRDIPEETELRVCSIDKDASPIELEMELNSL